MDNSPRFSGSGTRPSGAAGSPPPLRNSLWVGALYGLILLLTRSVELGDSPLYANDIVDHLGKSPFGASNSLWEFGHVLWRPLGWALLSLTTPLLSAWTDWTKVMQAEFLLICVSVACGLVTVVLFHSIALRISESRLTAVLVATGMACSHAVLLYGHSGCAYVPGLMCLTAGLYFLLKRRVLAGAVLFALATLTWFPYILAGAAMVLLAGWLPKGTKAFPEGSFAEFDRAGAIRFLAVSAALTAFGYALALAARHITSPKEALEWYALAGHGYSQNNRLIRMATGLPRSFLYLGQDGILYKRFLRHDPYSPVAFRDLVAASLWKLVAFYLYTACLLRETFRSPRSARILQEFVAAAVPVLFFAVFILEPGSPERYLPALPFLAIATAWALRDFPRSRRIAQCLIAGFLVCVVVVNCYSFAAPRVATLNAGALARVAGLRSRIGPAGLLVIVTNQDDLEGMLSRLVFDDVNRPSLLPLYDVIEPANTRVLSWRRDFAARVLKAWDGNGEVWISKRFWSARPLPSWNWAEGDDPRVSWKDLLPFFTRLQTDADSGGADGFRRLARNDVNLTLLSAIAGSVAPGPYN